MYQKIIYLCFNNNNNNNNNTNNNNVCFENTFDIKYFILMQ